MDKIIRQMKRGFLFPLIGSIVLSAFMTGCGGGSTEGSTSSPIELEAPPTASGSVAMLLIRVQYNNIGFTSGAVTWSNKIFGGQRHQLNHYYHETSAGKFIFERVNENEGTADDGVITVTLNKKHPNSGSSTTIHSDLKQAVEAADAYIDFSRYDTDGSGTITPNELQVMFIVAGDEDAYGIYNEGNPAVWAHQSCVSILNTPIVDGVSVMGCLSGGNYSLFGERHGTHDATIGIIAHELGHAAFALPDLYDIDYDSAGIGFFGMMGYGNWGQQNSADLPGNTPVHFSAWSKIANGWVAAMTLSGISSTDINLYETASKTYNVVKLPINSDEYFLLENRNNSGYDRGLFALNGTFGGGMAIWHIDESVISTNYGSNTVNSDATRKGVDLEEANMAELDSSSGIGHEKNLYYTGNMDRFDPLTSPNTDGYSTSGSGIYVENISNRGAVMAVTVTNPN